MTSTGRSPTTVTIKLENENSLCAIVLDPHAPEHLKRQVQGSLEKECRDVFSVEYPEKIVVAKNISDTEKISQIQGVKKVISTTKKYILVSREFKDEKTVVDVGNVEIGRSPVVIAGPCSVETEEQLMETAKEVKREGAAVLRGGAFKPRTSPYSFQGLGEVGLKLLAKTRDETGLPIVTEVMDTRNVELVERYADMLQVGARNMQNFPLLKELGRQSKPVLLKRSMNATIEDLLFAAEYIISHGNPHVVLCERGIRTFERATRNTLDISAVPILNELTHLPVITDPSHATEKRSAIIPMTKAAIAAGADGVMVEVHTCPSDALCDGGQSLRPGQFAEMMRHLRKMEEMRCVE